MANRLFRRETLTVGPYALLAFASLVSADPIVAVTASIGTNLLAPYLGLAWERQCYQFLVDPELRNDPLHRALRQAISDGVSDVHKQWQATPDGQLERRSFLEPRSADAQQTKAAFDDLRMALLASAAVDQLTLLSDSRIQLALGQNEAATAEIFRQYLLTDYGLLMDPSLAQFVTAQLPVALARAFSNRVFDPSQTAEPLRFAFDRLTQNLQLTLLQELALTVDRQDQSQLALREELQRRHTHQQLEHNQLLVHLQEILIQHKRHWDQLRQLAKSITGAEAAKARVTLASDLRWGITGPRVDIRVPAWSPKMEQTLPWEVATARTLLERRALVIMGKPSSGKTHLAGKLIRATPNSFVIIPRVFSGPPPDFSDLAGQDVILFLDDLHERAETFDILAWWASLEDACGSSATRLLVTSRGGDQWQRFRSEFLDSLPSGSVFEVPNLSKEDSAKFGQLLGIDAEIARKRSEGTIGSLILDFSEMGAEYNRMALDEHDGVYSSRLLDAAKTLHKMRQPILRESILRRVCVEVLGKGREITDERWNHLVAQTNSQGFGRFDEDVFVTYAPYLERDDVVTFQVTQSHLQSITSILLQTTDAESTFYLGLAALEDWQHPRIARTAFGHGMDLDHPLATFMVGELYLQNGDRVNAKHAFSRGMNLGNGVAAFNYGLICEEDGDLREAKNAYKRGMDLDHSIAAAKYGELLLLEDGMYDQAERAFRKAWELRGDQ